MDISWQTVFTWGAKLSKSRRIIRARRRVLLEGFTRVNHQFLSVVILIWDANFPNQLNRLSVPVTLCCIINDLHSQIFHLKTYITQITEWNWLFSTLYDAILNSINIETKTKTKLYINFQNGLQEILMKNCNNHNKCSYK